MKFTVTAGHGGTDPGNTWNGQREADLMLELRHIVAIKLREQGHDVKEDGGRGENQTLARAISLIEGADLAMELHTNASANTTATGVEVVAAAGLAHQARAIAGAIGSVLQIPVRRDRGWFPLEQLARERGFTPGFARRGGLIVEVFFQSNADDLAKYQARKWLVASAIAKAAIDSTIEAAA
jgi:N-acetylmuramoyl-L-alanine amidase